MRIIVTGAGGLLGQEVWREFERQNGHELFALGRHKPVFVAAAQWLECDLTNAALTYSVVTRNNPEVVIHCAAYNAVDQAETDIDQVYRANALACRNLALACQRFDATLLSVSTDYVFDGEDAPANGYREFDACNPASRYGQSKWWGEIYIRDLLSKFFIVRTSWLFGPGRRTWIDHVADAAKARQKIRAASDMVSTPTYAPELASAIARLANSRHYGVYHVTNHGFCSRVELAEEVLRLHKITTASLVESLTRAQLGLPAPRPAFSALENLAWRLDGFPVLRPWKDALREYLEVKVRTP